MYPPGVEAHQRKNAIHSKENDMMDMKTTGARSGMHKLGVALAVALACAGG